MSLFTELVEDEKEDKKIVKTFKPKKVLSPSIFNKNGSYYVMKDDIRKRLLQIANDFIDTLGVDFFIHDVVLTGSLANYNWSEYSDVDLHILFDMDEFGEENKNEILLRTIFKEFFDAKKEIWNEKHDIKIKNHDVEIYAQDIHEKHISSGVYSIMNNSWIFEPRPNEPKIDDRKILEKGSQIAKKIDEITKIKNKTKAIKTVDSYRDKIRKFRKCGLEKGGEYSYENLVFKLLRRNGEIKKLLDFKHSMIDKKFSIKENADTVIDNKGDIIAKFFNEDAISFGIFENQMIIGFNKKLFPKKLFIDLVDNYNDFYTPINGTMISDILSENSSKHYQNLAFYYALLGLGIEKRKLDLSDFYANDAIEISRTDYNFSGRFWFEKELISFWEYPNSYDELMKILNLVNNQMQIVYGKTIDFSDYLVDIINDDGKSELIPIFKYKKSEKVSSEELGKMHTQTPIEKLKSHEREEILKDKNSQIAKKEKGWGSLAQRNFILNKDIAENDD